MPRTVRILYNRRSGPGRSRLEAVRQAIDPQLDEKCDNEEVYE